MRFRLKSGQICKNNDHTCLFHCINTRWVPCTMFEHLAQRLRVQATSSDPANVNACTHMCDPNMQYGFLASSCDCANMDSVKWEF